MRLSRTTILTNFKLYINYINIKKPKKILQKKHHLIRVVSFLRCLDLNSKAR